MTNNDKLSRFRQILADLDDEIDNLTEALSGLTDARAQVLRTIRNLKEADESEYDLRA